MIIIYFESKNMLLLEESLFTTSFSFRLISFDSFFFFFFNIVSFRSLLRFHVRSRVRILFLICIED